MNKIIPKSCLLLLIGYILISPKPAQAVIPPDFIFNISTQVTQFFSIIVLFFTAVFGTFYQFFKTKLYTLKHKKLTLTLIILLIVATSLASSFFYANYKQKAEYQTWLAASEKFNQLQAPNANYQANGGDTNNQLNFKTGNIDTSDDKFVSQIDLVDKVAEFISQYYENISNSNYEAAYEMSKKSVDFETFKNWYLKTSKITLDNLVRIDEEKSSLELTLFEGESFTRYGVLMTLALENSLPVKVEKSEVKILAQGLVQNDQSVSFDENKTSEEYGFFNTHQNENIFITNENFKNKIESSANDYLVLDAREDVEYENGSFPGSLHIRFADLKAGRWLELPADKFIYVLCWSGIRGQEVAEFLRTKKIVAAYLENGANGWVAFGGEWLGGINFGEKYTEEKYRLVFTTDETKEKVASGVVLIDTREPYKFAEWHIAGSVNIPIMYTATIDLEKTFAQVPANSQVITVCDGYVNCFDAKITGVELEKRGHEFLGRYTQPWEYEE
ncbi:MAG: rhodanese-like domain-containing protein [Candidatus Uhrbacteria bacterium]